MRECVIVDVDIWAYSCLFAGLRIAHTRTMSLSRVACVDKHLCWTIPTKTPPSCHARAITKARQPISLLRIPFAIHQRRLRSLPPSQQAPPYPLTQTQVTAKAFGAVQALAEKCPRFSKRASHWFIPGLVEKLGDAKLRQPASDCLSMLCEAVTPQFVLGQAYDAIAKQKSPKTQENAMLWISAVASEFGLRLVKAKPLLDFCKCLLEATNPGVKKATIDVLASMRRQIGPDVRGMLSDVKPALLATIDEAFAKVAAEPGATAAPTRQVKGGTEDAAAAVDEGGVVNLTVLVSPHLKAMGDANWKERQAGIIAVDEVITKGKPLGVKGPYMEAACGDLWPALKARLKDSNKNLATQVLVLLAKLAHACGSACERHAKTVMPNMLGLISDNKKTVRDAVISALQAWADVCSPDTIVKYLPIALAVDAPAGREDAVRWAATFLAGVGASAAAQLDLVPCLAAVVESLEHRVAEVSTVRFALLAAAPDLGIDTAML